MSAIDELANILARNSERREDNETQFEAGDEAPTEIKSSSETIYLDDADFIFDRKTTYDSFILGKSILGTSKTLTTTADFNTGTTTGACKVGTNQIELD